MVRSVFFRARASMLGGVPLERFDQREYACFEPRHVRHERYGIVGSDRGFTFEPLAGGLLAFVDRRADARSLPACGGRCFR